VDKTTRRIGKLAFFLGAGFLAGLASFWGKVFVLPIVIAILILIKPRFVGWWGISLIALGSGLGFGLIKSSSENGIYAGGIILVILLLLWWFSIRLHGRRSLTMS